MSLWTLCFEQFYYHLGAQLHTLQSEGHLHHLESPPFDEDAIDEGALRVIEASDHHNHFA